MYTQHFAQHFELKALRRKVNQFTLQGDSAGVHRYPPNDYNDHAGALFLYC